jgi:integrase
VKIGPDGRPARGKQEKWHALGLKRAGKNAHNEKALTLHQAEREKAAIMRDVNGQVYVIQAHVPFREFLRIYEQQFVSSLKVPTQTTYRQWIRLYIEPFFGDRRLCDVKPVDVQLFFNGLSRTVGKGDKAHQVPLAPTTKSSIRGILASVFKVARIWGYWPGESPVVCATGRKGKLKRVREKRIPTPEDVRTILDSVDAQRGMIIETLMWTGLRISECLGLKPRAFDLDRGVVRITERQCRGDVDDPKSEGSVRTIPLGTLTEKYRTLMQGMPPDTFVFTDSQGRPYKDCELLANYLTPRLVKLGLKWPGFGWHTFRRALATWMDQSGASVFQIMEQLGHTNPNTTRLYVVGNAKQREAIITGMQERFEAVPKTGFAG